MRVSFSTDPRYDCCTAQLSYGMVAEPQSATARVNVGWKSTVDGCQSFGSTHSCWTVDDESADFPDYEQVEQSQEP